MGAAGVVGMWNSDDSPPRRERRGQGRSKDYRGTWLGSKSRCDIYALEGLGGAQCFHKQSRPTAP